jgi:hypothetical protein
MWCGARFSLSLSEGMSVPKEVGPPLVVKVRVPGAMYHLRVGKGKSPSARMWKALDSGD